MRNSTDHPPKPGETQVFFAADWPQWRGPNRDGKAADFKAPASWTGELKQQWRVTVDDVGTTVSLVAVAAE